MTSNFSIALADELYSACRRAQPCTTSSRSAAAAARRHIDLDPSNDLGQVGTAAPAYISSITLLAQTRL